MGCTIGLHDPFEGRRIGRLSRADDNCERQQRIELVLMTNGRFPASRCGVSNAIQNWDITGVEKNG